MVEGSADREVARRGRGGSLLDRVLGGLALFIEPTRPHPGSSTSSTQETNRDLGHKSISHPV